ncbi:hypothetical protein B6U74_02415 [Candidatus Bathyarchaeota archaeon ex4484_205]|nr:MAG: hypothetical protein B6U74_02415 [Candidatus Bathyarchaeota archaeon ex4484_205]
MSRRIEIGISTLFAENLDKFVISKIKDHKEIFWEIVDQEVELSWLQSLRRLREKGYTFGFHTPYKKIDITSANIFERMRSLEIIKRSVRRAREIKPKYVVIHPGRGRRMYPEVEELLFEISEEMKALDIEIVFENLPYKDSNIVNFRDSIEWSKRYNAGILFDVPHAYISGSMEGYLEKIEKIDYVHVSDTWRGRDLHLPLGSGEIPWQKILNHLKRFEGVIIIENKRWDDVMKSFIFLEKFLP